ncbi:unnamed protein product [Clonostachys chloroleuca]|uniref:RING-type domain-containing protein n=1 Tax=Clonostachys chloroleuca TaxID=1926264 RepID=A0AA35Q345_9HYPO|nr:unnamed protein product [Clonostachys chloroleuca]
MSSFAAPCGPFCTDQLHNHSYHSHRLHHHHQSPQARGVTGPSTPNNQRTVLEPPFTPPDRPSSPRHYSTASTFRNTAQPADLLLDSPASGYNQAEVTLPNLRPEDPFAYAHDIGWSPGAFENLGNLPTSEDSLFVSLADRNFQPFGWASASDQQRLPPQSHVASTPNSVPAAQLNPSLLTPSFNLNNTSNLTSSSATSLTGQYFDPLESFGAELEDNYHTAQSSFTSVDMPSSTTRRQQAASITIDDSSPPSAKRRRFSGPGRNNLNTVTTPKIEGSFAESENAGADSFDADDNAPFMIDLTETNNELPDDLIDIAPVPKEEDKRIKLSAFQCVICMDDASVLTLTHCGHMYCAQCLHSSLTVEATKGKCPMCRQKVDMRSRDSYNSKVKGYWPLELKLMTSTRKGKRKAGNLS